MSMTDCSILFYDPNGSSSLYSRLTLTDAQLKSARDARDSLLGFVKPKLSEMFDMPVKHWIQGSMKNHTIIRPPSKYGEFDIDVGLYVVGEGDETGIDAVQIKSDLHDAILDYCQFDGDAKVPDEVKSRCERVIFSGGFHIDIPLYYFDSIAEVAVLATSEGWESSDPKGFQTWFDDTVDQERRPNVRRVIKYLKSWAALKILGRPEKPMPSMALTILVAEFACNLSCLDDEADFSSVGMMVAHRILESEKVLNPLNGQDVLGFSEGDLVFWRVCLQELEYVCRCAVVAEDAPSSFYIWEKLFGHMLPPINETTLLNGTGAAGLPAVTKPALIEVSHYSSKDELISVGVTDSLISYKNESLVFKLKNKDEYPVGASVTWIVRNQGGEAADLNDLGHDTSLDLGDVINRGCAYTGVHYMDATIKFRGVVVGVGKVRVNIMPYTRPVKNPLRRRIFKGR